MSDPISPELANEIAACVYGGQKIAGIKLLREQTGKSLKDAKEFIEALEIELQAQHPEKFRGKATETAASPCGLPPGSERWRLCC